MYAFQIRDALVDIVEAAAKNYDPSVAIRGYSGEFFLEQDLVNFAKEVRARPVILHQIPQILNDTPNKGSDLRTNNETLRFRLYVAVGNLQSKATAADKALALALTARNNLHGNRPRLPMPAKEGVFLVTNISEEFTTANVVVYLVEVSYSTIVDLDEA